MRTYITAFMLVVTLGLVSCGGGNDVASSGASAVSAATSTTTPDVALNTTATTPTLTTPTKPKINGQIDERTGVAPVAAQATLGTKRPPGNTPTEGGCMSSVQAFLSLSPKDQIDCTMRTNAFQGTCNAEGGHYTRIKNMCPLFSSDPSACSYISICEYGPCTGKLSQFGFCD